MPFPDSYFEKISQSRTECKENVDSRVGLDASSKIFWSCRILNYKCSAVQHSTDRAPRSSAWSVYRSLFKI